MNIVNIAKATEEGSGEGHVEQQDVVTHGTSPDGTLIMGVFDGHGEFGKIVSEEVSRIVAAMTSEPIHFQSNIARKAFLRAALQNAHDDIFENTSYERPELDSSGSTATLGMFALNRLTVANLGDSDAVFYPDEGKEVRLTTRHDVTNPAEVRRVKALGFNVMGSYFGIDNRHRRLAVTRSIGDMNPAFVSQKASVKTIPVSQSGTIVMATDGVWGMGYKDLKDRQYSAYSDKVRHLVQSAYKTAEGTQELAEELTKISKYTKDDASVIVARVE